MYFNESWQGRRVPRFGPGDSRSPPALQDCLFQPTRVIRVRTVTRVFQFRSPAPLSRTWRTSHIRLWCEHWHSDTVMFLYSITVYFVSNLMWNTAHSNFIDKILRSKTWTSKSRNRLLRVTNTSLIYFSDWDDIPRTLFSVFSSDDKMWGSFVSLKLFFSKDVWTALNRLHRDVQSDC